MTHSPSAQLVERLNRAHVPFELIPHDRTDTAMAEAEQLGADPRQVGKTIVLTTDDGFVLAVVPASERLDLQKVRGALQETVRLATEQTLAAAFPEFELGAVPPVAAADRVLVDRRLCESEYILLEAGTHEQSVRLKTSDLLVLTHAQVSDFCRD